ncbi:uncharacterized protein LOC141719096 [Apium graveolens]|uniref:uncharacterized protein LOC141719096 n=1 Tax=Apium graveolens TaxID=4045 RepID=UPI003D7ABE4E
MSSLSTGLKKLNLDMSAAGERRMLQINELDEFRLQAYKNNKLYKENVKRWHDRRLVHKSFVPVKVAGPLIVKTVFPHGAMEIFDKLPDLAFKVNGKRLKHYFGDTMNREAVIAVLATT